MATAGFDTRVPNGWGDREQDIYFSVVEFMALPALKSANQYVSVDQDADLIIVGGARVVTDAATDLVAPALPPILITLRMVTSARDLMPSAAHIETLFGTAQFPATWPRPKVIRAGSQMRVTASNLSATIYNVRLTFYGFKVFPK